MKEIHMGAEPRTNGAGGAGISLLTGAVFQFCLVREGREQNNRGASVACWAGEMPQVSRIGGALREAGPERGWPSHLL